MENLKSLKIAVLMGGVSSERDVSLKSADSVYKALKGLGFDTVKIDIDTDNKHQISEKIRVSGADFIFIALHGGMGEDGTIQGIIESLDIAYTGSGVRASSLAMDKIKSRQVFKQNGLNVPEYIRITDKDYEVKKILSDLSFPIVVKPASQGSSMGLHIVDDTASLESAIKDAFSFEDVILLEKYIKGRELTVGVLADQPLPVVEIKPKRRFFDFQAKYNYGMTEYIVPAELEDCLATKIQKDALTAHNSLGCRALSRIDLILTFDNKPMILEVNTIPGLTDTSLLPKAAESIGIDFTQLCLRIIQDSINDDKDRKK